jgi:uncharacterized protein YggE
VRIDRERQKDQESAQRGAMKGFRVSNDVEVMMRQLDTLGRVLDDAIAAGANDVRRIALSLADPAAAAKQARTQAVEDARAKADELATAAGVTIGRVLAISETHAPSPAPVEFDTGIADAATGAASRAEVPISAGTNEVAVEVTVTYELK